MLRSRDTRQLSDTKLSACQKRKKPMGSDCASL